ISIIIKALPGCTEQKTYTATQDSLPSYFDDGTIHSGEPSTSNGDSFAYPYRDGLDTRKRRAPPVLFIESKIFG
uniref:Repulsive guidance molecule C-terminal domain-containing protein n=1 Tax=Romanomermis culicivorax TaxID=13658 RepID=A0A915KET9_ROMCU